MRVLKDTLASLCLTTIIDNFEKLFDEFQASDSSVLKRNFEYLQRLYSEEVLSKLSPPKNIHDKYIPFLLNKYVKNLDLRDFTNCDMNAVQKRLLEISDTVEKLTVCPELSDSSISTIVSHLLNVEYLDFSHSEITDATLTVVGRHCPKLEELILYYCYRITDQGLKNFCYPYENYKKTRCQLQSLHLNDSLVTDHGVQYILQEMGSLEELYCENLRGVLHNIYKINKTRKYNLSRMSFCDDLPSTIILFSVLCPKIRFLCLKTESIEALNYCTNFNYLDSVSLSSLRRFEKLNVDNFLELRGQQLHTLILDSFAVSTSTLIQCCPELTTLHLNHIDFKHTDEKINSLFRRLRSFTIETCNCSDGDAGKSISTILSLSPNLSFLAMRYCLLASINQEILALSALKVVDFSGSDVNFNLVMTLISTGLYIESVNLRNCPKISSRDYELLMTRCQSINSTCLVWYNK